MPNHASYIMSRTSINVAAGTHDVYHTNPLATYFAMLSGLTTFYSYGVTAGSRVTPINGVSNIRIVGYISFCSLYSF